MERTSHSKLQSVTSDRAGYTVSTADTLRSTTPTLSAWSDCRFSLHHTFTFASALLSWPVHCLSHCSHRRAWCYPRASALLQRSASRSTWRVPVSTFHTAAKTRGARCQSLFADFCVSLLFLALGTPTVTFCSVHIHNVVAKKRDASTELLQRLHGYMKQHNVDFIGGDFNMSAFSTVGDVFFGHRIFSTWQFVSVGDLVRWTSQIASALGFSSCQSVHMSGAWIHTAATNVTTQLSASDLVIKPFTFLCSYISAPPTCPAPTASCAVNMRNKEGLSADITNTSV